MERLTVKQVHLDFHTSEHCPDVGSLFDKGDFQTALKRGHLDSITVFAKCHHGWCYFPTKTDKPHPHLYNNRDLTGEMIAAAHEIGVKAPVYITVGWSDKDSREHPEWRAITREEWEQGKQGAEIHRDTEETKPCCHWQNMCINSGYEEQVYALTEEVCRRYTDLDGLFFDICFFFPPCYCDKCRADRAALGIDEGDPKALRAFDDRNWIRFQEKCRSILFAYHPNASIFFNSSADPKTPQFFTRDTHIEMEDLPTVWGGYDKMPPRAKFFHKTGMDYLGMTGKFHTAWGEFGGFKQPEALRFEIASMLAYGARCSVGDQMHPTGKMDHDTYRLIGHAYEYAEKIEKWCYDLEETTKLALLCGKNEKSSEGWQKMLLEAHLDFDVLTGTEKLSAYDTVLVAAEMYPTAAEREALDAFVAAGGGLVFCADSLADADGKLPGWSGLGRVKPGAFDIDYVQTGESLQAGYTSPVAYYAAGYEAELCGADVLASIRLPYFSRTYGKFCSHRYTPYELTAAAHPAVAKKGRVVYLAHDVGSQYLEYGLQFCRDLTMAAIGTVYTDPVLRVEGLPSAGRVRLARGEEHYALHLLYGQPITRGQVQVIEDLPVIAGVTVTVKTDRPVTKATLQPQNEPLPMERTGDAITLQIPPFSCHQLVVLE